MPYLLIVLLILLASGCTGKDLQDTEAPQVISVSIETNNICEIGGQEVACLRRNSPSDRSTVDVRIVARDNVGIAGYYILSEDSLFPTDWINITPAVTFYDDAVKYDIIRNETSPGDGIKTIHIWLKDLGGNISEKVSASIILVSGELLEWRIDSTDEKRDFDEGLFSHTLKIDDYGTPHIVYGREKLYHASISDSIWTIDKLDGPDISSSTGTLLDSYSRVHLSYTDENNNLVYATNSSGTWTVTTVDDSGSIGEFTDITESTEGFHISYYDASNGDLKYATCSPDCTSPDKWATITIDSSGDVGLYSSIEIGPDGSIHISYFDITSNALKYVATDSNSSWGSPIAVDSNVGIYSAIALDSVNNAHIAYYDRISGILKYATNNTGSWVAEEIDGDSLVANFLSIALDPLDKIHISYYDARNTALRYVTNSSGSWVPSTIDSLEDTGLYNSITVDSDNNVHISYLDNTNKALRYAVCSTDCTNPASWINTRIDSSGDVGQYNSIAVDTNGGVHVSYFGGSDLRYATNSSGEWISTIIDGDGDVGEYSSIAIDSAGNIHISYYDIVNKGLKYAICRSNCTSSGNWTFTTVDMAPNFGLINTSIGVDGGDGLHISYYDRQSRSLKYAACNGDCTADGDGDGIADNWTKVNIESGKLVDSDGDGMPDKWTVDVGQYSSIATDKSTNRIHISYYDAAKGDLKYATCDGSCETDSNGDGLADNWQIETVDEGEIDPSDGSADSVGLYTSIKLDSDGSAHISYFNDTSGDLMYAVNKGSVWEKAIIDRYDRAGIYTSISIGPDDKLYIIYYRYSWGLNVLKYATCAADCTADYIDNATLEDQSDGLADNWSTYILDIFDNGGMFVSIAVDSNINIAFFNPDTYSLNYMINE